MPPGLNVVHGTAKSASRCAHPDVRAISFTGSTATGNRTQSAGLKKFSMELAARAHSWFLTMPTSTGAGRGAVHDLFQRRALHRRQPHPGAAPDLARFCRAFCRAGRRITVGDPLDDKTIIGPMISPAHSGPRCAATSNWACRRAPPCRAAGFDRPSYAPRAFAGNLQARQICVAHGVCRRGQPHAHRAGEIFGPVVCLIPFDEADAIGANRHRSMA